MAKRGEGDPVYGEALATVHVFSNGNAIIEFQGDASERTIKQFQDEWQQALHDETHPAFVFSGCEVVVIEHDNPLGVNERWKS